MIHTVKSAIRIKWTYKLSLEFENGEERIFDFKQYVWGNNFIFWPLKDSDTFDLFKVENWTVVWETWADFNPNLLYKNSLSK